MSDIGRVLTELAPRIRGQVIVPEGEDYDTARRVWNGSIERRPGAVVRATGPADVIATVNAARDGGIDLAVRAGGHSISGLSTCDGGIVLDLSTFRGVLVDPGARTAQVAGGTLLGELDHETMAFELATPSGTVSHTGVAGLTLGGGLGRLQRKHGLSIDNLISVDLVTADGRLVRASEDEEPDLFWAIRGAGANFGVVTRFEFALHPQSTMAYGAIAHYALEDATDVLRSFREFALAAPDPMLPVAAIVTLGPGAPAPPELHGRKVIQVAASHCGDDEATARADCEPIRSFASPLFHTFLPAPYVGFQAMMDEQYAWHRRYYVKGGYMDELSDAAVDALLAIADLETTDHAVELSLLALGGAMGRIPEDATAFTGRNAQFFFDLEVIWDEAAEDERRIATGRAAIAKMESHLGNGNYINALTTTSVDAVRAAYGDEKFKKLVELKTRWDPGNLFRFNQNIPPRA